jgi:hypothetical protein
MAKAAKTKAKPSMQLPLDDTRWWPVSKIVEQFLPHVGSAVLTAHDLTEALANEKIRCIRRSIRMGHVDVDKLCDIELERMILGDGPSAAEHFSGLLLHQLFEPFARIRASHRVVTPKLIIAALGGDAGMILANGITLGQYVERLAAEANLLLTPGHRELVPASFWAEHCLACSPNGNIGVGFRFPPYDHGPSEPSSTLTANWAFFLWEPDCVKVWPALARQPIARETEESKSWGRKRGPQAEWQYLVAFKYCEMRYKGKPIPLASDLQRLCEDELAKKIDRSAINRLLRDLRRLLGD